MDLYGKLNNEIIKKEYAGSTTDTAKTIVDNTSNVIKTEVKRVPGKLTIDIEDTDTDYIYDGSEDAPVKIPTVGTVSRIAQKVSTLSGTVSEQGQSITNLSGQLTQLKPIVDKNTQEISALKSTKQDIIDNTNKLDADLVNDSSSTNKFVTSSQKEQITTNQNNIATINSKIMAGTDNADNKLTNVRFVNSSIATNTANFIGTFSNMVELKKYTGKLTNNDYAFVTNSVINDGNPFNSFNDMISYVTPNIDDVVNYDYAFVKNSNDNTKIDVYRYDISITDENNRWLLVAEGIDKSDFQKNPAYNRYKYTTEPAPAKWQFEYTLNNSSFTANQWAAINSGITSELVSKIGNSTLVSTTDPTTATVGEVGQFYLNTTTNKIFQCQSVDGDSYTWGVPNVNAVTLGTEQQQFEGKIKVLKMKGTFDNEFRILAGASQSYISLCPTSSASPNHPCLKMRGASDNDIMRIGRIAPQSDWQFYILNGAQQYYIDIPFNSGTVALTSDVDTAKAELQAQIGDIRVLLDTINGEVV